MDEELFGVNPATPVKVVNGGDKATRQEELARIIARRAYELFESDGQVAGR